MQSDKIGCFQIVTAAKMKCAFQISDHFIVIDDSEVATKEVNNDDNVKTI